MLKPSELSPAMAALLTELLPQYLDREVYHIVNGAVPETTKVCIIIVAATYPTPLTLGML